MKAIRKKIGLYSKLEVTFNVMSMSDEKIFRFLTKKKYTFSKRAIQIKGIYEYSVNVGSIDKAYKLKLKIDKFNKINK